MNNMTSWTGNNGNNWFDPGNWTMGLPSTNLHGYIPENPKGDCFPVVFDKLCIDFTLKNDGKIENEGLIAIKENGILQNNGILENQETAAIVTGAGH